MSPLRSTWRRHGTRSPQAIATETQAQKKRSPFRDEGYVGYARKDDGKYEDDDGKPLTAAEKFAKRARRACKLSMRKERARLTVFHDGLAKVRRVLANIPTYMMFDDHDFTDDWNLNPMWYDRVYTHGSRRHRGSQRARQLRDIPGLGQRSDPLREAGRLQGTARKDHAAVPAPGSPARLTPVAKRLDALFGFKDRSCSRTSRPGRFPARNPIIKWHYSVPGPKHLAVAIDNRTRRSFVSRIGPPGNVEGSLDPTAKTAQTEQIPAGPFTDGKEVLLVIAPLQVIGPPLLDELVAPAAFHVFDA